jgi:hypothetical protein
MNNKTSSVRKRESLAGALSPHRPAVRATPGPSPFRPGALIRGDNAVKKIVLLTAALTLAGSGAAFAAPHARHMHRAPAKEAPARPSTAVRPATK